MSDSEPNIQHVPLSAIEAQQFLNDAAWLDTVEEDGDRTYAVHKVKQQLNSQGMNKEVINFMTDVAIRNAHKKDLGDEL